MTNKELNKEFITYLKLANDLVDGNNNDISKATNYCDNARQIYCLMVKENNPNLRSLEVLNKLESSLGLKLTQ